FIIAAVLLFLVFAVVGLPDVRPVVQQIVADSPASHSDFRVGDKIVAVNGVRKGTGQRLDISLKPKAVQVDGKDIPRVGIGPERYYQRKSVPAAIGSTVTDMPRFMWATVKAL